MPPGPAIARIPSARHHPRPPAAGHARELLDGEAPVARRRCCPRSARAGADGLHAERPHVGLRRRAARRRRATGCRTVPHGIEPPHAGARPSRSPTVRRALPARRRRSILYPAITYPHKDHVTLVRAFARLAPVAARPHARADRRRRAERGRRRRRASGRRASGDQVRRTGRIPWADLDALYAAATVVAVPVPVRGLRRAGARGDGAGRPGGRRRRHRPARGGRRRRASVRPGDVGQLAARAGPGARRARGPRTLAAAGRVRAARFTWDRAGRRAGRRATGRAPRRPWARLGPR